MTGLHIFENKNSMKGSVSAVNALLQNQENLIKVYATIAATAPTTITITNKMYCFLLSPRKTRNLQCAMFCNKEIRLSKTKKVIILQPKEKSTVNNVAGPIRNYFNPIALRKAKTVYNSGLSECNRFKHLLMATPNQYIHSTMCFCL